MTMKTERIHSDFETISQYRQEYRISTSVEYLIQRNTYRCKATLFKSWGGKILDERQDRMYRSKYIASEKEDVDTVLSDCIEECRTKLDEIEDSKDISIEVNIDG